MGTKPKVSIIIPVYNVELYVERCLQSIMSQTYKGSIECLIVDDCGTDKSMNVVEQLVANYHGPICFRILHHEHNRGVSGARNTGMEAATGDYLFFLDSDDEISADCFEKLTSPLTEGQYDLVVGNIHTIGNDRLGKLLSLKLNDGEALKGKKIMETYRKDWNMMAQNKLYQTCFVREQGLQFKEGLVHEDELWSFQVACLAQSLRAVNQTTYVYYKRRDSITTSIDARRRRDAYMTIIEDMRCFLIERNIYSANAYSFVLDFFWALLKSVQNDRHQFIQDYCRLRQATRFPLSYRVRARGFHLRAQTDNLYFLMPPKIAARIIYWRKHL